MYYSISSFPANVGLFFATAIIYTGLTSGSATASTVDIEAIEPRLELEYQSASESIPRELASVQPASESAQDELASIQPEFDSILAQDLLTSHENQLSNLVLAAPPTQITQLDSETEDSQPGEKFTVEVIPNISTTGLGVSLATPVSNYVKARIGFNGFSLGIDAEADDIDYDGDLKLSNFSGGVDIYPFGPNNMFFIGAGLNLQNNRLEASGEANSNQTFDINGTTYAAADVGKLDAEFEYPNRVAPYIGIGVASPIASNSKFGFFANLGVMFAGQPDVSLSANGTLADDPQFSSDLKAEADKAEDDINLPSVYPIFSLGASYRF